MGIHVTKRLWGLACSQAWNYFRGYPKDHRFIKLLVSWPESSDLHLNAGPFLGLHMLGSGHSEPNLGFAR
jgi:hypothetical protein